VFVDESGDVIKQGPDVIGYSKIHGDTSSLRWPGEPFGAPSRSLLECGSAHRSPHERSLAWGRVMRRIKVLDADHAPDE
jgi:hypothetical protein